MNRRPFLQGAIACFPVALSIVPFGAIVAVTAREAGLTLKTIFGMSVIVFAGAAQLVSVEMARTNAPALLILLAALLVNLRFLMYSASLAPTLRQTQKPKRALMAYLLTDQAFSLSLPILKKQEAKGTAFYLGAGSMLWLAWQSGTALGVVMGAAAPPELSLEFCVAIAFVALSVPFLKNAPTLLAAGMSMAVYLLASALPYGLALVPAVATGIITGVVSEKKFS